MTYKHYDFFAPSGPGTTSTHPPPDTQIIRIADTGRLFVSARRRDGSPKLTLALQIGEEGGLGVTRTHRARLSGSAIIYSCGSDSHMPIELEAKPASFVRDGTTNAGFGGGQMMDIPMQVTGEMLGLGYVRENDGHHDVSYGHYEFYAALPECQQPSFSVQVPPIEADGVLVEIPEPIIFKHKAGRYFNTIPY